LAGALGETVAWPVETAAAGAMLVVAAGARLWRKEIHRASD